jgi:hypothetical protein
MWPTLLSIDTARLPVDLDAAEAGQQVRDLAVHEVAAVELGGDLHGEAQPGPRRLHALALGHGAHEVSAQADEGLHASVEHAFAGLDRVQPFLARRLEAVELLQLVERRELRLLGDADGALALHVRVAAHRADAGAGLAHVAAQEQQVAQHLDVLHALAVLREPHAVDADHGLGARVLLRRLLDRGARQARLALDVGPVPAARGLGEGLEAVGVLLYEGGVERMIHFDQRLAQPHQRGGIAAGPELVVLRADARVRAAEHLLGRLRIGEAHQARLAQRIEGDDRHAALARRLEVVQHARAVHAHVLAEEEQAVGPVEVVQHDGPDRHADALG